MKEIFFYKYRLITIGNVRKPGACRDHSLDQPEDRPAGIDSQFKRSANKVGALHEGSDDRKSVFGKLGIGMQEQ